MNSLDITCEADYAIFLLVTLLFVLGKVLKLLTNMPAVDYNRIAAIIEEKISAHTQILKDQLKIKENRIMELERKVTTLESKLDDQEQYSRRTSVRISGIPEQRDEDVKEKLVEMFRSAGINPTIQRCHRVGPKVSPVSPSSTSAPVSASSSVSDASIPATASSPGSTGSRGYLPRPIICQFTGYLDRQLTMNRRKEIRIQHPNVWVNEDLTRARSKLLYQARQQKKSKKILDAWSADGRILVKDKAAKIHLIRTLDDLKW